MNYEDFGTKTPGIMYCVIGWIIVSTAPQYVYILILGSCDYYLVFVDVTKLRIFKIKIILRVSSGPDVMLLIRETQEESKPEKAMWWWKQKLEFCFLRMDKGPQAKKHRWLPEAGKGKEANSSFRKSRSNRSCGHLDFSPVKLILYFLPLEL